MGDKNVTVTWDIRGSMTVKVTVTVITGPVEEEERVREKMNEMEMTQNENEEKQQPLNKEEEGKGFDTACAEHGLRAPGTCVMRRAKSPGGRGAPRAVAYLGSDTGISKIRYLGDTDISKKSALRGIHPGALRGKLSPSKHATTFPCTQRGWGKTGLGKDRVGRF
jgi:hypothetical protein